MALRLSSSTPTTMQTMMDCLVNDGSLSLPQKLDVVKTLQTVLSNLEKKGTDIKYRTLNTKNEKLQQRLFCFSGIETMLVDLIGFEKRDDQLVLADPPSAFFRTRLSQEWLPALASTQTTLASLANGGTDNNDVTNTKKAKLTKSSSSISTSSTSTTTSSSSSINTNLSEKQKARLLMEKKQEEEKLKAKLAREKTRAQIAADKRVRMEDENWKPGVCAAAAKGGTKLQTFRDRHGE